MSAERVLKGCNCCLNSRRAIKYMGLRARISWCRKCKAKTVWDLLSPEQADAYSNDLAKREAFIARLFAEANED